MDNRKTNLPPATERSTQSSHSHRQEPGDFLRLQELERENARLLEALKNLYEDAGLSVHRVAARKFLYLSNAKVAEPKDSAH
jgi:hypothetical protein